MITDLNDINTGSEEGKLLMAALAMITTTVHRDKEPGQVIEMLNELAGKMYALAEVK